MKRLANYVKAHVDLTLVVLVFILSRIIYFFYFGVRFDISPLTWFWQYLDVDLLKQHLLQSVFYSHSQPPGFNLFLGLILKLFPLAYPAVFHFIYMALGLLFAVSLYGVMKALGVRSRLSLFLTLLFMASPIVLQYENWLFYEYPTAAILAFSLLFLHRFSQEKKTAEGVKFFSLLALVVCVRGLLSLYWFFGVTFFVLVAHKKDRRKILLACFYPFLFLFFLYFKNFLVFHSFSVGDAFMGQNVALSVVSRPLSKDIVEELIQQKKISGLHQAPTFAKLSDYKPYGIEAGRTGIPVLDQAVRSNQEPNTFHLVYLDVGKRDLRDASYVLRHYPGLVFESLFTYFRRNYFLTSDQTTPFTVFNRSERWERWEYAFNSVVLGKRTRPIEKARFLVRSPLGGTVLDQLIQRGLLEESSKETVRLKGAILKDSEILEIAGSEFDRVRWFLRNPGAESSLLLVVGLPLLLVYGLLSMVRSFYGKHKDLSRGTLLVFMMSTLFFIMASTLFMAADHNRVRFLADSFYLILFALLIHDLLGARKCLRFRSASTA